MTRPIPMLALFALAAMSLGNALGSASDEFIDLRRIDALRGDADAGKAKAAVCGACHGPAGIAPVRAFPNLAGQHAEYLYWRLVEFKREARPDSPMTPWISLSGAKSSTPVADTRWPCGVTNDSPTARPLRAASASPSVARQRTRATPSATKRFIAACNSA